MLACTVLEQVLLVMVEVLHAADHSLLGAMGLRGLRQLTLHEHLLDLLTVV